MPLETDQDAVAVGKTVVMMGYPSGPDRLLALLDDAESRGIQQRYGSLDSLLGYLAETRRIQPLTTQGNITDLDVRRIAYDARTAEGRLRRAGLWTHGPYHRRQLCCVY